MVEKFDIYTIILSDEDYEKCDDNTWKKQHWNVKVKDDARHQISFDVFGGGKVIMTPIQAFNCYLEDAVYFMNVCDIGDVMVEFGYTDYREAKQVFEGLKKAYYKCRRFIGSDDDIIELYEKINNAD